MSELPKKKRGRPRKVHAPSWADVPPESDEAIIKGVAESVMTLGDEMFDLFKERNEPDGPRNNSRSTAYEIKAKRAQRLAELFAELTPFQQKFSKIYVERDWDTLSEIAIRAGSKANPENLRIVAYNTMKNPVVREAIGLMTVGKIEAEGLDRLEVIQLFRDNHATALLAGDHKAANEAARALGELIGLFSSKVAAKTRGEERQLTEIKETVKEHRPDLADASMKSEDEKDIVEQLNEALRKSGISGTA